MPRVYSSSAQEKAKQAVAQFNAYNPIQPPQQSMLARAAQAATQSLPGYTPLVASNGALASAMHAASQGLPGNTTLGRPDKPKKGKSFAKRVVELPFKVVRETWKPVVKRLPKGVRNALPAIGAIGGSLIGGPIGGAVGGAFGGSLRGGTHLLDHSLGAGALGALGGYALGGLDGMGGLTGAGAGAGMGPGAGGGASSGLMGGGGMGSLFGSGGLLNSLIGGGGGLGTLLNTGLLAASVGGAVKAKKRKDPNESETLQDAIDRSKGKRPATGSADWDRNLRRRGELKQPPKEYRGTNWNYFPSPEEQEDQLRRVNEEIAQEMPQMQQRRDPLPEAYARGGLVKDYYRGKNGGQSDKRLVKVRPKSYIVNATTVSLAGDGNSENGAKIIKDWARSFQNGHFSNESSGKVVKAYVSDGELKLRPEEVMGIGNGDINNGVKVIKKMENKLRKHKGVNKFLPPKSKSLDTYAGIKR